MSAALSPLETRVLDFVREHVELWGFAPTMDEIAAHFGVKSKSSAFRVVDNLVRKGMLERRRDYAQRGLALPGARSLRNIPSAALEAELRRRADTPAERATQ